MVLPLTGLSDHSKIITTFKNSIPISEKVTDNYNWKSLKMKFKWDAACKCKFVNALKSSVKEMEDISQRIEAVLVASTGTRLQELFTKAAHLSMEIKKKDMGRNWKKRKKSKKWFDKECDTLKREVCKIAKDKHKDPQNNLLRSKYHEKLKLFKRKCKSKRFSFWQNKFSDIENSLNSSKDFWKKWKTASESETSNQLPNVTGDQWFNHFKNLHTENSNEKGEIGPSVDTQTVSNEPFSKK